MKPKVIHLIALLFPLAVLGQQMPIENGKLANILPVNESGVVVYQSVETVSGASKADLYQRARQWFVKSYKSANSVLQVNDPATGELSGKGVIAINPTMIGAAVPTYIDHTVSVEVKDGRYRVTFNDFYMTARTIKGPIEAIKGTSKGFLTKVYTLTDEQVRALLASLNKEMNTTKSDF